MIHSTKVVTRNSESNDNYSLPQFQSRCYDTITNASISRFSRFCRKNTQRKKIAELEGKIDRSNVSKIIFDCMCLNFGKLLQIPKLINHNPITQKIVEKI